MSTHLTHEELTDNLLGVSSFTVNAHLVNCSACTEELELMKQSITGFRGAAHGWSESVIAAERTTSLAAAIPRRSLAVSNWASANWVLTAAAVLVFTLGFLYLRNRQPRYQDHSAQIVTPATTVTTTQSQIEKDNELLSQVNREIAEAVPAPMQPLQLSQSSASVSPGK